MGNILTEMQHVIPGGGEHRGTSKCRVPDCPETTREGKPFCPWHVALAPYPAAILRELDRRAQESKTLDYGKPVGRGAHLIREALLFLRIKSYSGKSFARTLDISHAAAGTLIHLLGKWGLARVGETERKDLLIQGLVEPDLATIEPEPDPEPDPE